MKSNLCSRLIYCFMACLIGLHTVHAQVPEKYNYQAVVRDSLGNLLANTEIGLRISILQGSASGTVVYEESHLPTTNSLGLFNLQIGTGTILTGSFANIDWGNGPYFQQIEVDVNGLSGGLNYLLMGTTELISVPFALYAKQAGTVAGGGGGAWSLSGNSGTNPTMNFIGTTDSQALRVRVNNLPAGQISEFNTSIGVNAGANISNGLFNDAFGLNALINNVDGNDNVAVGTNSLYNNLGSSNTSLGRNALRHNQTGFSNIAVGAYALYHNVYPGNLVAVGDSALYNNNIGGSTGIYDGLDNTAVGSKSLFSNTTGSSNTGLGMNALYGNLSGVRNTATGKNALLSNVVGLDNTAMGFEALRNNTSVLNTAIGSYALYGNTTGSCNNGVGYNSLSQNTSGYWNSAIGCLSLFHNSTGIGNVAMGYAAAYYNNTGKNNIAIGTNTLYHNQYGGNLVAMGDSALFKNGIGVPSNSYIAASGNTAVGSKVLMNNTEGWNNSAFGYRTLYNNTTGIGNTAIGINAMYYNINGAGNVAVGDGSLQNNISGQLNVALGSGAMDGNTTGWYNVGVGTSSGGGAAGLVNSVALGYASNPNNSNVALLGNTTTAACGGYANWTNFSDGRFKKMVRENVVGLDFIKALRPVTYQMDLHGLNRFIYKDKTEEYERAMKDGISEKERIVQSGFIAQEVEWAASKTGYSFDGVVKPADATTQHYSLSYASFVVPLVKAVQEQQLEIEENQQALVEQKQIIEWQGQLIEELKQEMKELKQMIRK